TTGQVTGYRMSEKKARSMAGLPWIAAMAFFMQALDATILNTALPAIAHSLNRSPLAMQSAIISYTLTVAMLIPVLNFVTMPGLGGPILGPVLGGILVTWASWHGIFLINIPIGIVGILYARKYMPNFTTSRRR